VLNWLLIFSLIYLLATTVVLVRNRYEFTPLLSYGKDTVPQPKISVCIPARNEEKNIAVLLESILIQDYSDYEVLVLDDQSTDHTNEIVTSLQHENPGLIQIYHGVPMPYGWLGKPWACMQLGEKASGDIILFLDADTTLQPNALADIALSFRFYKLDMAAVWPKQILETFWENTVIPLIYYTLLTILPAIYVYRDPRWMPSPLKNKLRPAFAAANGQCIAFTKSCYHKIGGHKAVKNNIVEDVELAKAVKKQGGTLRMFNGTETVTCRMYRNNKEMFSGLRKNFLAGFQNSLVLFITAAVLHIIVFILPYLTFFISLSAENPALFFLSVASITFILLHRLIIAQWFGWNPVYAFTHPVGVCWFQWLGLVKIYDRLTGKKTDWKGRKV
jgi:chlorobactene glucosyltransferase